MDTQPKRGQNSFMRLHSDLVIEDGFNLRTPTAEAIEEKLLSIIANGVITDFQVYKKKGEEKYTIIEGHTRWLAIGKGIAEGSLPEDFLIPCKSARTTSDKALNYLMLTANNGVSIPPIGKAEGYKRAIAYGDTVADIAKELGVSQGHINECLSLLNANHGLQEKIKTQQVSATLVAKKLKEQSSDEIEREIEEAQQKTGKKKVTKKDLPTQPKKAKIIQSDLLKEISKFDQYRTWLSVNGHTEALKKFNELF